MPRSHWKIHLSATDDEAASNIINRCVLAIGRPQIELRVTPYSKGGFMATLAFHHNDSKSWPEVVFEVIEFAQCLGHGWQLLGHVRDDLSGVLAAGSVTRFSIPGLLWAEWQISKELNQHQES
jgi:hypothetical protein